ncbi:MAG TPA: hemerythrin domain-containing protein [Polyangiaceae bacterium]|nr:hemerythrin domain-containing protein [Polyangiaceae bacterium]
MDNSCLGGRMTVTLSLHREHRNIEQSLALLRDLLEISSTDFHALASDLAAHLAADEDVLYPAVEEASAQVFTSQRAQHARVREAALDASKCVGDARMLRARIVELAVAFAAHARLEEGALHACLESRMSDASLQVLAAKLDRVRGGVAARCREGSSPAGGAGPRRDVMSRECRYPGEARRSDRQEWVEGP